MIVTITDIDQSYSLKSGAVTNYIVLELPSGLKVRVLAEDADAQAIINESHTPQPQRQPIAYDPDNPHPDYKSEDFGGLNMDAWDESPQRPDVGRDPLAPEPTKHQSEGMLDWENLPDTQLPPMMKSILKSSRVAKFLTYDDLQKLKGQILERLKDKPQAGQVNWSEGARRQVQGVPRRTVPMDDAGNPIPPGGIVEADPGEGPDEDDDGVAQA